MLKSITAALVFVIGCGISATASEVEQSISQWLTRHFSGYPEMRWEVVILQGYSEEDFHDNRNKKMEYALPNAKFKRIMDLRLRRIEDQRVWHVKVQAKRLVKTITASEFLKIGTVVNRAWQWEERDMDNLPNDWIRSPDELTGKRTRKIFMKNEVFTAHALEKEPAIRNGSRLTLRVLGDGLTITSDALAMEDGHPGNWMKARCIGSDQIVKALVLDNQNAQIALSKR